MRRAMVFFAVICWACTVNINAAFSDDNTVEEAAEKAAQIHKIAESDTIYLQDEIKALYYQNIQIIDLLQQIRDLLQQHLQQSQKE